jgi:hypothetical protein
MKTKSIPAFLLALGISSGALHAQGQSQPAPARTCDQQNSGGNAPAGGQGAVPSATPQAISGSSHTALGSAGSLHTGGLATTGLRGATLQPAGSLLQKPPGAQQSDAPQPATAPKNEDEQLIAELQKLLDAEAGKQKTGQGAGGTESPSPIQTLISLLREKGGRAPTKEEIASALDLIKSLLHGDETDSKP